MTPVRKAIVIAVIALVLFGSVTLLKLGSSAPGADAASDSLSAVEKQRTLRFWEIYRTATDDRIAGRTREAAEAYARALELNPQHEDALYYLGSMQLELGRFAAAEQAWRRLLQVNPASGRAHSRLGVLYSCLEPTGRFDLAAAESQFRSALELNKEQIGPLIGLAEVAVLRRDFDAATRYLDQILGSNSSNVEAHYLKGYIAWARGDRGRASASLASAIEHAQPLESETGVPGEGDTRAGSRPMLAATTKCQREQLYPEELEGDTRLDAAPTPDAWYASLDSVIARTAER